MRAGAKKHQVNAFNLPNNKERFHNRWNKDIENLHIFFNKEKFVWRELDYFRKETEKWEREREGNELERENQTGSTW